MNLLKAYNASPLNVTMHKSIQELTDKQNIITETLSFSILTFLLILEEQQ